MVLANALGLIKEHMKDIGRTTKRTGKAFLLGRMVESSKVSTRRIKDMDKVSR